LALDAGKRSALAGIPNQSVVAPDTAADRHQGWAIAVRVVDARRRDNGHAVVIAASTQSSSESLGNCENYQRICAVRPQRSALKSRIRVSRPKIGAARFRSLGVHVRRLAEDESIPEAAAHRAV
jgi:hypothetical protein